MVNRIREVATHRDELILEETKRAAELAGDVEAAGARGRRRVGGRRLDQSERAAPRGGPFVSATVAGTVASGHDARPASMPTCNAEAPDDMLGMRARADAKIGAQPRNQAARG